MKIIVPINELKNKNLTDIEYEYKDCTSDAIIGLLCKAFNVYKLKREYSFIVELNENCEPIGIMNLQTRERVV